jgi:hypothetical protein
VGLLPGSLGAREHLGPDIDPDRLVSELDQPRLELGGVLK